MATTTTCDHCSQPIDKSDGRVVITVQDIWSSDRLRQSLGRGSKPAMLDRTWDLHRDCYVKHVLPSLDNIH
jgi:hypothetical protein